MAKKKRDQSISQSLRNWRESDLPYWKKVGVGARNQWRKMSRLKSCCGFPGECGC